jgi:outer membrane protein assembly factor BamB
MVIGYRVENIQYDSELERMLDNLRFMCTDTNGFSEEKYEFYKEKLLSQYSLENKVEDEIKPEEETILKESLISSTSMGPMDSAWPMKCHNLHHTSRSPYSTAHISNLEKWRFHRTDWIEESAVICDDGTIYFGCFDGHIYALYSDGTKKWSYKTGGWIWTAPAIAEDGTIYVGSMDDYLHAINPDGTRKWRFYAKDTVYSSPAIAEDGTIYFGVMGPDWDNGRVYAVNPNGTEKWHYDTGDWITSDPAIADDGTVYIGSLDSYFYALYPNGTLRWRFKTGDEIHGHPSIADGGTIYIGSFDDYLYALYPNNGTMKWKFNTGWGTCANPSIASDGTIYVGTDKLYAIYPSGMLKWSFNLGSDRYVGHSSPAVSADGTIYVGTHIGEGSGGDIIAINSDGTERWRKKIANLRVESSPCIAEDGTVYIGSSDDMGRGYLHAFGPQETNEPPGTPTITGPLKGKAGVLQWYRFTSVDPDNNPVSHYIEWDDGTHTGWTDDYASGEQVKASHIWSEWDEYTIRCKSKDTLGEESGWGELRVTMPRNRAINGFFLRFLEQFPLLQKIFTFMTI